MAVVRISRDVLARLLDLPEGVEIRNSDLDVRTLDVLFTVSGPGVPDRLTARPQYEDHGFAGLTMDAASHKAITDG